MNAYQSDAIQLLHHSFEVAPGDLEMIPLTPSRVARKNDKKPARAEIVLPDDWVKNIKGYPELQDVYMVVMVPRELWQNWRKNKKDPKPEPEAE